MFLKWKSYAVCVLLTFDPGNVLNLLVFGTNSCPKKLEIWACPWPEVSPLPCTQNIHLTTRRHPRTILLSLPVPVRWLAVVQPPVIPAHHFLLPTGLSHLPPKSNEIYRMPTEPTWSNAVRLYSGGQTCGLTAQ